VSVCMRGVTLHHRVWDGASCGSCHLVLISCHALDITPLLSLGGVVRGRQHVHETVSGTIFMTIGESKIALMSM
jgi:hypothetical protein